MKWLHMFSGRAKGKETPCCWQHKTEWLLSTCNNTRDTIAFTSLQLLYIKRVCSVSFILFIGSCGIPKFSIVCWLDKGHAVAPMNPTSAFKSKVCVTLNSLNPLVCVGSLKLVVHKTDHVWDRCVCRALLVFAYSLFLSFIASADLKSLLIVQSINTLCTWLDTALCNKKSFQANLNALGWHEWPTWKIHRPDSRCALK